MVVVRSQVRVQMSFMMGHVLLKKVLCSLPAIGVLEPKVTYIWKSCSATMLAREPGYPRSYPCSPFGSENITRFGGNQSNVTLFGESGGGAATQAVIATPGSKGLVHRVIPQSESHSAQRTEKATEVARRIINQLNIRPGDIDALRRVQWQTFVDVYETLDEEHLGSPQIYLPVINRHMPVHPVDAAHHGIGLEIDYLIGTCRDEANFFPAIMPSMVDSIFHRRALQIIESIGLSWEEILVLYARSLPHLDHDDIFNRVVGDMWFRIPAMRIVEGRLQHLAQDVLFINSTGNRLLLVLLMHWILWFLVMGCPLVFYQRSRITRRLLILCIRHGLLLRRRETPRFPVLAGRRIWRIKRW